MPRRVFRASGFLVRAQQPVLQQGKGRARVRGPASYREQSRRVKARDLRSKALQARRARSRRCRKKQTVYRRTRSFRFRFALVIKKLDRFVGIQNAFQMIHLMLKNVREKSRGAARKFLSVFVECTDSGLFGARDDAPFAADRGAG